ncbi:dihydroorotase [Fangia hongkongensis]|uniref:dihydroorotase n=1 Tax=Fangia hongkongensis TaxID=270495 RepID=UPI000375DC8B|nr:dihydroorotase [Fangia hongkongensis]MBK2123969.1 dihydroorotase [Fangia hongkongensis]
MSSYLIKNPTIVNEGKTFIADVYINNGRIEKIGSDLTVENAEIIDAEGLHLFPGMIDDQVHFREPGLTYKADIESESKAAVMGGITSYMEMPNCTPPTVTIEKLNDKKALGAQKSHANFAFYLGATNDNVSELQRLKPSDACGVKIFMGASTGNMLVDNQKTLEGFFENCPILIATHCEDTPMIAANEKRYKEQYGENMPFDLHAEIRSREACLKSSNLAVALAKKFNSKLHVLHITTQDELAQFKTDLPLHQKRITAEVCAHHLFFSRKDYQTHGALIKCNPSVKEESDRLALLKAVNENVIDVIATDHAPHTWAEKSGSYFKAPSGLPLVQDAFLSLLEHYHKGVFTLEKIVQKTAHAPAIVYQVKERGFIREGYFADLVLVNLNAKNMRLDAKAKYKCGWTPFNGAVFSSNIEKTFVNGVLKYADDKIVSDQKGEALAFSHAF